MGQGCIVLFILVAWFTQQKDAVLLRGLGYLPLNVIDNPVISAMFCTVLPQKGARLILLNVTYLADYFICAGRILLIPLTKCPASGGEPLLQSLQVKCSFRRTRVIQRGLTIHFLGDAKAMEIQTWWSPRDRFLMRGRYFFTLLTANGQRMLFKLPQAN